MKHPTSHPYINALLDNLLAQMQAILKDKLTGLYLYGSLVTGDFDPESSDIDLLAAVASDLDEAGFDALNRMQEGFAADHPQWEHRLEIAYLSLHALKTFKTEISRIAVISPGEPFHFKEAGRGYLPNWYVVQEKGITLFGPPPGAIIDPISREEFIQVIKEHVRGWREWVNESHRRPGQAYAILTLCRALYTCQHGEQVSKLKAATWAKKELPQWAALIDSALHWRRDWREAVPDQEATFPETRRFVHAVIDLILAEKTAFVSISFAHKDELAAELDTIRAALAKAGFHAHIFVNTYTFTLDQQREMMAATLADLSAADLLIAEVTHKAIGVGIEVGIAAALGKPILYLRHADAEPSTTVGGLAAHAIVYRSPNDLREQLAAVLVEEISRA